MLHRRVLLASVSAMLLPLHAAVAPLALASGLPTAATSTAAAALTDEPVAHAVVGG